MKIKATVFFAIIHLFVQAQIKVNNKKTLMIVFPSEIVKASVGSNDYSIEYNKKGTQKYAFLKSVLNASESNLIAETQDGYLYNIDVFFSKEITNTYVVKKSEGINLNEDAEEVIKPSQKITNSPAPIVKNNIKENDYTIGNTVINDAYTKESNCDVCELLLKKNKGIKRITKNAFDIKLDLENVYYANEKIYVIVNLYNQSSIDYKINYIKTYIQQGKESAKSSAQYLETNPIQIYNSNRIIENNSNRKMIFIYNQFTIDQNKNLIFELNESNGERNLKLQIPNYIINEPNHFK